MAEIDDLSGTDASNTGRFPEGQAPSTVNDGARALEGMLARFFQDGIDSRLRGSLSTSTYEIATNRSISAYDGLVIAWRANAANTVGAVKIAINGGTAHDFQLPGGVEIPADYIATDQWVWTQFKGTASTWQMVSPIVMSAFALTLLNDASATAVRSTLGLGALATAANINNDNWSGADLAIDNGGTGESTASAAFDALKQAASDSATGVVELATTAETLTGTDTGRAVTPAGIKGSFAAVYETAQASTSGTAISFAISESGRQCIKITLAGVSMNADDNLLVQLSTGSTYKTSGYVSGSASGSAADSESASGFIVKLGDSSRNIHGVITLEHIGGNVWHAYHSVYSPTNNAAYSGGGSVSLGGAVDGVRVVGTAGATFNAGTIGCTHYGGASA